jgi:predicted transcriptional regulator
MYKANLNCVALKDYLDRPNKQGLVSERIIGKGRVFFSVTQKGIKPRFKI